MRHGLIAVLGLGMLACGEPNEAPRERKLDIRLETHAVLPGQPSAAGLAYLDQVLAAHREADAIAEPLARADR